MTERSTNVDVVIVGAGFAGMYQLVRMRRAGFSAIVLETADDVGGTWYWNRYPGARCDILSVDYSYSWDPELQKEWQWSERYAAQPEILRYAQFVADKHDLRRDMRFNTRVTSAEWDDDTDRWTICTDNGDDLSCRYYIMATGCLSMPKVPDIEGTDRYTGEVYFTSTWPHDGVDFTGKRVAVIGTGSSAVQSIPLIAAEADQLTVFQRTPNFSIPARNGPISDERLAPFLDNPDNVYLLHASGYEVFRGRRDVFLAEAAAHGLTPGQFAIFLPGCNVNGHLKRWGAARYAALANQLHQEGLERIALIGGPDEIEECQHIAQACGPWLVNLCGQTAVFDIPSLCEPARFIVANDTGTAHLAAATPTPMLVLCGPTDPRRVKPLGDNVITLQADLPCINCYRKTCSHHSCMAMLTPSRILQRLRELIG